MKAMGQGEILFRNNGQTTRSMSGGKSMILGRGQCTTLGSWSTRIDILLERAHVKT